MFYDRLAQVWNGDGGDKTNVGTFGDIGGVLSIVHLVQGKRFK